MIIQAKCRLYWNKLFSINLIAFNVTSLDDLRTNLTESSNLKFVFEVYVRSLPLTLEFEAEVLNQI